VRKPYLRQAPGRGLADYPEGTAYTAGFLTAKNAGWRSVRPVLHAEKCVLCLRCYLHCPDGTVYETEGGLAFDYDFCKGCGLCAKICPLGAIEMRAEGT
jgi:2-oxoacid:acceptor oxidoreductase delta subunit (pyruvate/2-ketoisovalerate family)